MKTLIQIDVQNLFFSAKDHNKKIDFLKLIKHFKSTEDILDIIAYIIRTPDADGKKFEGFLRSLDYKLNIKTANKIRKSNGDIYYSGTDQDMAIAIDCMTRLNDFDKWILMSGDGDFVDLCRHLKTKNKIIDIWSVSGNSFNKRFCDFADTVHFLTDEFFYDANKVKQKELDKILEKDTSI